MRKVSVGSAIILLGTIDTGIEPLCTFLQTQYTYKHRRLAGYRYFGGVVLLLSFYNYIITVHVCRSITHVDCSYV